MIPPDLSLRTVKDVSFGVLKMTIENVVKKIQYHPLGPYALKLTQYLWSVLQSGPAGAAKTLLSVVMGVIPLVWSKVPPHLRGLLEGFFVAVLLKLT